MHRIKTFTLGLGMDGRQQRANMIEDYTEEWDAGLIYINTGPGAHTPLVPSLSWCVCARELMTGKRFDSLLQPPLPSTLLAPDKNGALLIFFRVFSFFLI